MLIVIYINIKSIVTDEEFENKCLIPALRNCEKIKDFNLYSYFGKNEIEDAFPKYQDENIVKFKGNLWLSVDFTDYSIELSNAQVYKDEEPLFERVFLFSGQVIKANKTDFDINTLSGKYKVLEDGINVYIFINNNTSIPFNSYEPTQDMEYQDVLDKIESYLSDIFKRLNEFRIH